SVIHGGEIVMDQRITGDTFERRASHQSLWTRDPKERRTFHDHKRPDSLASTEARIAHGSEKPLRPGDLPVRKLAGEHAIEQALGVLHSLKQAILILRGCVQPVLMFLSKPLHMR